ncbi:hypothetical protein ACFXKY_11060 [Streptomyces canus]|uniref:hypothetical protein n=1 Tax=Streptomyces canus TaxID=58343 RepID=UPI0036A57C82
MGGRAGIRLVNSGLGPAIIVQSTLTVDDEVIGAWDEPSVDRVRDRLSSYDPQEHAEVENLISRRLTLKIRYESLYGGENYTVLLRPIQ